MIAIHTENLTRDFKSVRAVDSLTLDIPMGIVFGFLGPNRAGKSTTISMLSGLLNPTKGEARIMGNSVHAEISDILARTNLG